MGRIFSGEHIVWALIGIAFFVFLLPMLMNLFRRRAS